MRFVIVEVVLVAASPFLAGMLNSTPGCAMLSAAILSVHIIALRTIVRATKNRTVEAILSATTEDAP